MGERPLLTVAHRAGNSIATLREALDAGVDLVEGDVHRHGRVLEMRHWKALGPDLLWDRWALARRRDLVLPDLAAVLDGLASDGPDDPAGGDGRDRRGAGDRLMLDLKGVHRGLGPAIAAQLRAAAPGAAITVCARNWWLLGAFAGDPHVRLVLSAGSRLGLRRLRARLRVARRTRGVVGVSVHRGLLTPAVVAELHGAVDRVLTWPVDEPAALADARRLGVSGVISKNLPLLRGVIDRSGPA
jgi:hypothetical protein